MTCYNGGTLGKDGCVCTENFYGNHCQYAKETVEIKDAVVNATVEMRTKVDNRNFTDDLKDKSSEAFQNFEKDFKEKMREVYKYVEGYQDVVIHDLSEGSVVVNYTVLLSVPASNTANKTVESISQSLISAFDNYTGCNETCEGDDCAFCFNSSYTNVTRYKVEEVQTDLCDSYIEKDFRPYYSQVVTATGVVCVTQCEEHSANPYHCDHGDCYVTNVGPQCECREPSAFWYQDKACSLRISKVGVAVGVPVAVLVATVAVFTVFLMRIQRQKEEYRVKLTSRSELYCNEEERWTSLEGFATSNQAATWEDSDTPSAAYVDLEKVDTSQKIHIQRPSQIVVS